MKRLVLDRLVTLSEELGKERGSAGAFEKQVRDIKMEMSILNAGWDQERARASDLLRKSEALKKRVDQFVSGEPAVANLWRSAQVVISTMKPGISRKLRDEAIEQLRVALKNAEPHVDLIPF